MTVLIQPLLLRLLGGSAARGRPPGGPGRYCNTVALIPFNEPQVKADKITGGKRAPRRPKPGIIICPRRLGQKLGGALKGHRRRVKLEGLKVGTEESLSAFRRGR